MSSVALQGVNKKFGELTVLHDIDIDVPNGEFLVLVGPSGCGKSTLLRAIAGLEKVTGGRLMIDGKDMTTKPPKDRDIAMVFQNYALYPHMTVSQNMSFSLRLAAVPKAEADARVKAAAEILDLTELVGRYPRQLSGGQRQRVAMGRALVRDPKVFLFDEPLSNLDAKLRVQMRLEIKQIHQRLNATMIYVTHDQVEAMTMADRIVVMRKGRIEQIGAPLELYDRPVNMFVAGFIGSPSMNFVTGTLRRKDGDWLETVSGTTFPLPRVAGIEPGTQLVLGIRPEHLAAGGGIAAGEVIAIEPMGAETQIHLKVGSDTMSLMSHERIAVSLGAPMKIGYDLGNAHVFDASTGDRLVLARP